MLAKFPEKKEPAFLERKLRESSLCPFDVCTYWPACSQAQAGVYECSRARWLFVQRTYRP